MRYSGSPGTMAITTSNALTTLSSAALPTWLRKKLEYGVFVSYPARSSGHWFMVMTKYKAVRNTPSARPDAPFEQAAAPQRNDHVQAPAEQEGVGNQRDKLEEIVRRPQTLVIARSRLRELSEIRCSR